MTVKHDTKKDIIEAAQELFSSKGYAATSMAEIARHVGITKPALYYFFKNKQDIYLSYLNDFILKIIEIYKGADTSASRDSFRDVLQKTLEFAISKKAALSAIRESELDMEAPLYKEVFKNMQRMERTIESFLKKCSVPDAHLARLIVADTAHGYLCRKSRGIRGPTPAQFAGYIADLLFSYKQ